MSEEMKVSPKRWKIKKVCEIFTMDQDPQKNQAAIIATKSFFANFNFELSLE
jgi:hypothetical protein